MPVLDIVIGEDSPVLRKKAEKIPMVSKEIKKLIKDMHKTVKGKGVGLAGPQVGKSLRLCLATVNGKMTTLINPNITWKSEEEEIDEEGCLSLPGIWVKVSRPKAIILEYQDEAGKEQQRKVEGFDARVVQHEVDHLDGILITDYRDSTTTKKSSILASNHE